MKLFTAHGIRGRLSGEGRASQLLELPNSTRLHCTGHGTVLMVGIPGATACPAMEPLFFLPRDEQTAPKAVYKRFQDALARHVHHNSEARFDEEARFIFESNAAEGAGSNLSETRVSPRCQLCFQPRRAGKRKMRRSDSRVPYQEAAGRAAHGSTSTGA
eukprot:m.305225 g.305225  ORF g.305225 m.305225 type:complete len:159 (-) comp17611_c0_seq1:604-1080(-)